MSAIKNFYFDEINSSNAEDLDYQYEQYLAQQENENLQEDSFSAELPSWMRNFYR